MYRRKWSSEYVEAGYQTLRWETKETTPLVVMVVVVDTDEDHRENPIRKADFDG